ncbi:substrate-binding domain-containing protein [Azospirillum melinis]|uniref:Substrate-binding domain-containing protein n=1 Tax=Azospirillum melinis TaxID=328839 RepID=A0ABX2KJ67_9PROT|nr:substrate-binding domain-containing protein [Azospirillum melinis]MBP2307739.1 ribose transport system substrate-binding protein [Azospirillum melinis]NUB02476.1 substrate-binding domain-containing protein [Azospirillum melinis]
MSKKDIWMPGRRELLKVGSAGLAAAAALPFVNRTAWGETGVEGKTIGFTMSFSNTEWIKQMQRGVVDTAAKYGMKTVVYDANDQPAKQVRDIEDLLVRNVDIIIISTYYADAIRPAVQEINRAGIPIVVLSSPLPSGVDFNCLLSTDMIGTARKAGEYYVKKLNGEGSVVQIEGKPGSLINQQRGSGWREVIDKHPGIKVVSHVVANYDRTQAIRGMEDALQANPKIDAVYSHNDDMALGAVRAAAEFGREKSMFFTGFDGLTPEALEAIHNGTLDAVWEYLPFGVEGVEAAVRILQKKPIPKTIAFESPMITKENVLEWYDPETRKRRVLPSRLSL